MTSRPVRSALWIPILILALTAASAIAQENPPSQGDMNDFMKAMGAMMSGGSNAAAVVDFRELKALLPAELPGLKRTGASGEKSAAMGMTVAYAEGTYSSDEGSVTVKISDNGGLGGLMAFAQAAWAHSEIDRETDTGFERTTTCKGYKAHEEFDNENKSGSVEVLVADRFMVEVSGSGVPFDSLKAAVDKIDLAKLATIKPKPQAQPAP